MQAVYANMTGEGSGRNEESRDVSRLPSSSGKRACGEYYVKNE